MGKKLAAVFSRRWKPKPQLQIHRQAEGQQIVFAQHACLIIIDERTYEWRGALELLRKHYDLEIRNYG